MIPKRLIVGTLFIWTLVAATAVSAECQPDQAFKLGLAGHDVKPGCDDRSFRIDYELGRQLMLLRKERDELDEALAAPSTGPTDRQARLRRQRLERELDQIEGVARIRGLLPVRVEHREP